MIGDYYFTADERTLLALYLEDTKAQTEENISRMQKELTSAEKDLFLLAKKVLAHETDGALKAYSDLFGI